MTHDLRRANAALRCQLELVRAGLIDVETLWDDLRRSELLVPTYGDRLLTIDVDDTRWTPAFTSELALARWMRSRDLDATQAPYVRATGARLVDHPTEGLAVDLGGDFPMLFPTGAVAA